MLFYSDTTAAFLSSHVHFSNNISKQFHSALDLAWRGSVVEEATFHM